ncbi:histone H2A-like [Phasianus colchicus]|uniref:histone H2A-like n=1 Tax=Phasianus colchicus TaxID=9054 RepID=UPI00129D89B2|nr:histone H2A-like [Phasianus colchicus]
MEKIEEQFLPVLSGKLSRAGEVLARVCGATQPQTLLDWAGKGGADRKQQQGPANTSRAGRKGTGRQALHSIERPMEASSMAGTDGVSTAPEQKREPEASCSGEPSMPRKAKAKKSRSSRAGLLFPVSRIERQLRKGQFAERFGASAPVYLAAVLQWVTHKTMDMAGKISKRSNQQCISPSHLQMSVKNSSVLKHLLGSGPKHRGRPDPKSQHVASPSKTKKTKRIKRSHRQQAAPAHAAVTVE